MKLLILLLSLIPALTFAQVYKSVDADGNIIYTDIAPTKDAKELEVEELNVSDSPKKKYRQANTHNTTKTQQPKAPDERYAQIKITSPENDATIRNNEGKVSISVSLTPNLYTRFEDQLFITVDGNIVNNGKAKSVNLNGIDRGTHTVTAYVQDKDGKILLSSQPASFHMFRFFKRN